MRLDLNISHTERALLEQQALPSGKDLSDVVLDAVRDKLGDSDEIGSELSDEEWRLRLAAFAERHRPTAFPLDDSRETTYADRS